MFTGIVESTGKIKSVLKEGTNLIFEITCDFTNELTIGQSIAHDGVCLTVTSFTKDFYCVTAIDETIKKTNLISWKKDSIINLERCLPASGRFDGHVVQGHVETIATCTNIKNENGSTLFQFALEKPTLLIVDKGSICINGVSLTVVSCTDKTFTVAIIPHTLENTGFKNLKINSIVNIEFDIIGKYVEKMLSKK